jgi:6-phosphogluconolactonase
VIGLVNETEKHLMKISGILSGSIMSLAMLGLVIAQARADGSVPAVGSSPQSYFVYIGTFTTKQSKGIYLMRMDATSGSLSKPELVAEAPSPAFLALAPNHHFLYSVNEVDKLDGKPQGGVSAFSIDATSGKLTFLNRQFSAGGGPTHISLDRDGKNALVANYGTGSVAVLPIGADGKLAPVSSSDQHAGTGADPQRQKGPHAHCINVDPDNRYALSCDLGLDKIFVYRFDPAKGAITPNDPPAGTVAPTSGPRHLAFHPNGKRLYVVNEMACTVTGFNYDADKGTMTEFQSITTLPEGFKGNKSTAAIAVHPSGKFLYASNRGAANSIASYKIDPETGKLTLISITSTQGRAPRDFSLDPTGNWLVAANQDTNNVVVFRIDAETGELKPTGTNIEVPSPVCVTFLEAPR